MTAFVGPDGGSVHIEEWSFLFFTLWALSIQSMLGGYPSHVNSNFVKSHDVML
jgi:hypothetical protein